MKTEEELRIEELMNEQRLLEIKLQEIIKELKLTVYKYANAHYSTDRG